MNKGTKEIIKYIVRLGIGMTICGFITITILSLGIQIGEVIIRDIGLNLKVVIVNSLVYGAVGGCVIGGLMSSLFATFKFLEGFSD